MHNSVSDSSLGYNGDFVGAFSWVYATAAHLNEMEQDYLLK